MQSVFPFRGVVKLRIRLFITCLCCVLLSACATKRRPTAGDLTKGLVAAEKQYEKDLGPDEVFVRQDFQTMDSRRGDMYIRRTYFPATEQLISYAEYGDAPGVTLSGSYRAWYDGGEILRTGTYAVGKRVGEWTDFHRNGKIDEQGQYVNDKRSGGWKSYDDAGRLRVELHYNEGERDGKMTRYDRQGREFSTTEYERGTVISEKILLESEVAAMVADYFFPPDQPAYFPGCGHLTGADTIRTCNSENLMRYVYRSLVYPESAIRNDVEGLATVGFTIGETGDAAELQIINGVDASIARELTRIFSSLPTWTPATYRGDAVRARYEVPVRFRLR